MPIVKNANKHGLRVVINGSSNCEEQSQFTDIKLRFATVSSLLLS
jgi:hypothetical protein